ncbi:MAG TPA: GNAT family N-acetyltransferase [Kiritimatiellia bacterium]|nr:GNAT family N-acetyltransferase [Kiritimatiellia bacterium]
MDIVIQPASLDLADGFWRALDVVAREHRYLIFQEAPPLESTRKFIAQVLAKGWIQFYAVGAGQVVGWCDVVRDERPGLTHIGRLGIGILPEYRGRKIGARLLAAAIADAFQKGITRIELEVFAANARAIALYRKFGFVEEGRKRQARCLDGVPEDSLCMALLKAEASPSNPPALRSGSTPFDSRNSAKRTFSSHA